MSSFPTPEQFTEEIHKAIFEAVMEDRDIEEAVSQVVMSHNMDVVIAFDYSRLLPEIIFNWVDDIPTPWKEMGYRFA